MVHGGMAQDVGPILEMVTEKYLLRAEAEWQGRQEAMSIIDEILAHLQDGRCAPPSARPPQRNFLGPIQTIIPWASNLYTETLIQQAQAEFGPDFWGFWMMGGMAGGGMGFIFDPHGQASRPGPDARHHAPGPSGGWRRRCPLPWSRSSMTSPSTSGARVPIC